MKRIIYTIGTLFLFSIAFSSCEKVFMESNPKTDNRAIYNEYWKLVDEKYAMWENPDKNLDKEAIHDYTSSLVTESMSQDSLFGVLAYIVHQFKDGHTWLEQMDGNQLVAYYDIESVGEKNIDQDLVDRVYLKNDYKTAGPEKYLKYKLLEDGSIGYIELRDFMDDYVDDDIDEIIDYFANTKGIIFDVRGNGGGSPFSAVVIARHFTEKEYFVGEEWFKTGPGEKDFSKQKLYNTPASGNIYTKPVMVLTDNLCFSATTTFIYYLNPVPSVTFIGSRTGGGSGSTADGYLANGWHWELSTSEFIDYEGRHLDNGFEPDIHVLLDTLNQNQDEIIERAIQEIL